MFGHPAWGAFCGCFEGSELLVTPAFLLAVFLSSAQPSSAPTSAQGQKGAAALLLVGGRWGERLVVGARFPLWLFRGGREGPRTDFPQISGRGRGILAE